MVQVCHYVIFRNKVGIPTTVGQGASSFRKNFSGNVLPRSYNASIQLNDHAKVTRHACMQVPNSCVVLYILQVLRTSLPFCPPFNGNSKLGERGGGVHLCNGFGCPVTTKQKLQTGKPSSRYRCRGIVGIGTRLPTTHSTVGGGGTSTSTLF